MTFLLRTCDLITSFWETPFLTFFFISSITAMLDAQKAVTTKLDLYLPVVAVPDHNDQISENSHLSIVSGDFSLEKQIQMFYCI